MTRDELSAFLRENGLDCCCGCKHLHYNSSLDEQCSIKHCKFEVSDDLWNKYLEANKG